MKIPETNLSALHFHINRRDHRSMMVFNHRQIRNTLTPDMLIQIEEIWSIPNGWEDTGKVFKEREVVREDKEEINGKIVVTAIHRHTHQHASNAHTEDGMLVKTEYPNKIRKIR